MERWNDPITYPQASLLFLGWVLISYLQKSSSWTFWLLLFPGTSLAKFNCAHNFASVGDSAFSVAPLWLSTCHFECPLKTSFVLISRPLQKWWCYFEAGFGMSYKIKPWLYEKPEEDKQLTQTWIRPKHMLYQGRERECFAVSLLCLWGLGAHGKPWQTCYEVSGFRPTYRILGPKALSSERFQPKCPRFLMDRDEGTGRWGKAPAVFLGSAGTSPMHTHPVHFPQSWALETQASLYKFQSTVQPLAPIQTLPISSLPPCCFEKLSRSRGT